MKKSIPILAFLFVFLLAACSSATEAPPPTLDQGEVDASVNATLTAMAVNFTFNNLSMTEQ